MNFRFDLILKVVPAIALIASLGALYVSRQSYLVSSAQFGLVKAVIEIEVTDAEVVGLSDCCVVVRIVLRAANLSRDLQSVVNFSVRDNSENSRVGEVAFSGKILGEYDLVPIEGNSVLVFYADLYLRMGGELADTYRDALIEQGLLDDAPKPNFNVEVGEFRDHILTRDGRLATSVFNVAVAALKISQVGETSSGKLWLVQSDSCVSIYADQPIICPVAFLRTSRGDVFASEPILISFEPIWDKTSTGGECEKDWGILGSEKCR